MSPLANELFKAVFVVAIFASICTLARLFFLPALGRGLKLALGGFLVFMLLPLTYLYLRLALPEAADALLPFQAMAIWLYGPALLVILHLAMHRPIRRWQAALYAIPPSLALAMAIVARVGDFERPDWWELLSLCQALLFAVVACAWTLRRRGQLRVLVGAFSASSFGVLLYLSAGLLALLAADFYVHWLLYSGKGLPPSAFYAWVAPCALYSLGISLALVWRAATGSEPAEPEIMDAPEPPVEETVARKLELSETAARGLAAQLEVLMREQRLYTRNDLSLVDLAAELRISTHLTSELLNAHLGVRFYALLNRHRATAAAELLRRGEGQFTLADVAYEAGFNNPNTFHREFKRAHGVTPAQFRRALRAPASASAPAAGFSGQN